MTTKIINRFAGLYRPLSCFHMEAITLGGIIYPSAEHAFHAQKTANPHLQRQIAVASTAAQAKAIGRSVPLIDGWDEWRRYGVMTWIQATKFAPGIVLGEWLLTLDAVLIHGNAHHDQTWGVCYCAACKGKGHNLLGWILMRQRVTNYIQRGR